MTITSSAFKPDSHIPDKYSCNGENINPPLEFFDLPEGTVTLALIVTDPDSPSGHFTHWVVFNIDHTTREIVENSVPYNAKQGKNDFGHNNYGGPCPGYGTHHYVFQVYALDAKLDLYDGATRSQVEQAMSGHILAQGELTGLYTKK